MSEGDEIVHSEYSKDSFPPASILLTDSESRYIKATPPPRRPVRGRSEILYPTGHNSARTAASSVVSQVPVIAKRVGLAVAYIIKKVSGLIFNRTSI